MCLAVKSYLQLDAFPNLKNNADTKISRRITKAVLIQLASYVCVYGHRGT